MLIHFVCSGNTNRSRLAEAYFNSKKIPGMVATSSGIYASANIDGPITFFAKDILERAGMLSYTAAKWQETTKELLEQADVVVFIKQHHFDFVKDKFHYIPPRYYIWNIEDVWPGQNENLNEARAKVIKEDEKIFDNIKQQVDQLILEL